MLLDHRHAIAPAGAGERVGPRNRRRTGAGVVLGVVVLGLAAVAACGAPTSPDAANPSVGTPPPGAPASFVEREPLASCGQIILGQMESVPADAWACLDAAFGSGAELAVTTPTTEGDPMVTYYRVGLGIEGMELFSDSTADEYAAPADRRWSHWLCPETVSAPDPEGCLEV